MGVYRDAMVMDITPWPSGNGFAGSQDWWHYILSKDEKKRLDHLLGAALLDDKVRQRLVNDRDSGLMDAFGLTEDTKRWLCAVDASSLTDLAQAIVKAHRRQLA